MTDGLPRGWQLARVGDVASYVRGVTYQKEHARSQAAEGCVPVLRANNIGSRLDFEDLVYVPALYVSNEQRVQHGDVVIAMSSGSKSVVGKAAIATSPPEIGFGAFCGVLRPSERVNSSYLGFYFQTKTYRNRVSELSKGVNINNLKAEHLLGQPLPLPPSSEQQRIVSRIEELFSEIDEGERALERVQKLVERYRQSVLKAAVTGELTREWRQRHRTASTSSLLEQFAAARSARGQRSSPVAMADVEGLPELPDSWIWVSLDSVAEVAGGITVDRKRSADGCDEVPYLRVANVQRGYLDLDEVKTIVAPRERIAALRLLPGDILFNEGGDIDKLGRGWLWQGELPLCIHQNHVFRARLFVPGPWNKLISWFGNVLGKRLFMDMGKQTTNLASLSLSKLKSVPVPLMPYEEAVEIVSRAEDALSVIDKCLADVARQRSESSALRQSVLKAAFCGQLVPQDPTDEPASALLARLAAEGSETASAPRRRGRVAVLAQP